MPSGGSINIALIPIVLCAFAMSYKDGIIAGFLWWFISSLLGLNNYIISLPQYLVDYVLPSCVVGICSIFYSKKNLYEIEIGIFLMMFIRTLFLIISGVYFWPGELAAGSLAAWAFSIGYNLPYSFLTYLMLAIITPVILKRVNKRVL